MDEASTIAWLHRRFGFGLGAADLRAAVERGLDREVDRLLDPDGAGVPVAADPWDGALFAPGHRDNEVRGRQRIAAVDGWLERMRTTPRPLHERMAWVWHDHFATSIMGVPDPALMVQQIRTIQRLAMGTFDELLRAMTIDAAMLFWLDGESSTAAAPNENHGRELLELFTVGVGNHDEDDVRAAARALTGWIVEPPTGRSRFVPPRHDDTAQVLLGRTVHDVDSVVDAVCSAPACATYVATVTVERLLGPLAAGNRSIVRAVARSFSRSDLDIGAMVATIVDVGLDRLGSFPMVEAPAPWLVRAERSAGARLQAEQRHGGLRAAGQVPLLPPDVGGYPVGDAWWSSATVVGRVNLAVFVATATPASTAVRQAAIRGDLDALALELGRPDGFSVATRRALQQCDTDVRRLALALCAPDQVVV
jgi:uncharacterized protein (DUF1800 family)